MSFQSRTSSFATRLSLVSTALIGLMALSASAQTAPQLLPYTTKLLAGGGATATFTVGATCPVAGAPYTATDAYGDGCLATEIILTGPRYAIADKTGTVFVADYAHGLIRRIDPITGIITSVAGFPGGTAPTYTAGTACGASFSVDTLGDGCLSTAVKLGGPTGMVFDANGNLYFSDTYNYNVRKIAATGGVIPSTGGTITLVAGSAGGTLIKYGYTSGVNAASASYLDAPYALALDTLGDLFISEEYKNAILVVNTNTTGSTTVAGVSIPAGQIVKIEGEATTGGATCPNGNQVAGGTYGCNYGNYISPSTTVNDSYLDAPYAVGVDPSGNVYIANEYDNSIAKVTSAGVLTNFAGKYPLTGTGAKVSQTARGLASSGTFGLGSDFGLTVDTLSNIYFTDALNGYLWRIDGASGDGYVLAGGATTTPVANTTCATVDGVTFTATDAYGDGCPGPNAVFGNSGTSYASTGIFGVTVDANANAYVGDTGTNLVREVASGTQFGVVGANQPTDIVDIHFAAADAPATTTPYAITTGASNFAVGKATCTTNSDNTTDCLLAVTATPTVLGPFTGTLTVKSALGATSNFPLSGNYVQSPVTRTTLAATAAATCTGSSTYSTTAVITLTATVAANGPSAPGGTVIFKANGTTLAPTGGVAVTNTGTTSSPVYQAVLPYTFSTAGTYVITATYTGDSYFKTSTSGNVTISTSLPTFAITASTYAQGSTPPGIAPGQTALYSFNVVQSVYTGNITFTCSGLPAKSSCVFNPSNGIVGTGCSVTSVIALSILTTAPQTPVPASLGTGFGGKWQALGTLAGLSMALLIGLRRRKLRFAQLWMSLALLLAASSTLACNTTGSNVSGTPAGTSTITVTATGSDGTVKTAPITLIVN